METEKLAYTIDAYFINKRLIFNILDDIARAKLEMNLKKASNMMEPFKKVYTNQCYIDGAISYIVNKKVEPLDKILLDNKRYIKKGRLIYIESDFYFKDLSKAYNKTKKGKLTYAKYHIKVERFKDLLIFGHYNPEHITCNSAFDRLSGHKTRFMFAYVEGFINGSLQLNPIIIGDRILSNKSFLNVRNDGRIMPEEINEFEDLEKFDIRVVDINEMKKYSEKDLKKWIAEIIGEKFIQKDWGGEKSDLFTTNLHIKKQRIRAAFLLKGPSKFHPMSIKDLGKQGDQIVRLFDEPADIYILQHCHFIKSEVEKMMSAFASRFYDVSYYCIINGIDTFRILKSYHKI